MTTFIYKSGIYQILNLINGKSYIGSSNNIHKRFIRHKNSLKRNDHENIHLQRSWNKYGDKKFEFKYIEEVVDLDLLLERERIWMEGLKTYERSIGYNLDRIGEDTSRRVVSDETKQKMSLIRRKWHKTNDGNFKGRHHTEENKKLISKKAKERYANGFKHPLKDIGHTDETKQLMSEIRLSNPYSKETWIKSQEKRIETMKTKGLTIETGVYDLDNNLLFICKTQREVCRKLNIDRNILRRDKDADCIILENYILKRLN